MRGDCVLLFIRLLASGRGSGIAVESRYAHLWELRGGRGVRVDAYYDRESALAALRAAHRATPASPTSSTVAANAT